MTLKYLRLKKGEDRRVRAGHPWIFSNEVDIIKTPLKSFVAGEEVLIQANDDSVLGRAYVNPQSLISARLISRNPNQEFDCDFFQEKLTQALALRTEIFKAPYYRLIFSEADGLPGLVIDRFGDDLVLQINTAGMEQKIPVLVDALLAVIPETHSILLRNDTKIREHEGLETYVKPAFGTPPETVIIEENGVKFHVPLLRGQKTGWFYDHRMNRARLAAYAKDRRVLDVFSYLGGWGIQAAAFGASSVDCIDASPFACDLVQKNAELNQVANKVTVICEDAFDALKALQQQKKQYDLIILDPPAFVKRFKDRKEGLIAYQRINEIALRLLAPNGILFSCSCSMHVTQVDMLQFLQRAAFRSDSQLQLLERGAQGPDHPIHLAIPESDYLKSIVLRKLN